MMRKYPFNRFATRRHDQANAVPWASQRAKSLLLASLIGACSLCISSTSSGVPAQNRQAAWADESLPRTAIEPESCRSVPDTHPKQQSRAPHPEPRVIIEVLRSQGPREVVPTQAMLRANLWGKIIACYSDGAYAEPSLRGDAIIRVDVDRSGKVQATENRGGSMTNADVVSCWKQMLRRVPFGPAKAGTNLDIRIWVAPGDRPRGGIPPDARTNDIGFRCAVSEQARN